MRAWVAALLSVGVAACGDSGPTTPPTPTPAPGRWVGAQPIDGAAPTNPSSAGAVVSTGSGSAVNPHVGIDGAGAGLAVWNESQAGIASARWERGAWATARLVASAPSGAGPARLAVSTGGDALVAWRETDAAIGRSRIWAVRYAGGSWGAREALQASSNEPGDPAVAIDPCPCGNAAATWAEHETGQKRVWSNRHATARSGG